MNWISLQPTDKQHRAFGGYFVAALGLAALIASHMVPLFYIRAHKVMSGTVIASVVGLVLAHLRVFGLLFSAFRHPFRNRKQ
jgi:hypothetical protein